jgi:glycosyltransferase involved in cell wall biosynthesis
MNKKISVVIRCKNEERWIGHTIQSVLDLVPENEILVVDNNSQDKSLEIVQQFRSNPALEENKIKYSNIKILNIDKYSPGLALNKAAKVSSSDYLMFLSSHCVLTKFDSESILDKLKHYAAIFGNQDPVYRGQKITKRYLWSHFSSEKVENMYSEMEQRYFFHNALSIMPKEVLLQNPFDEALVGKEDRYWASDIIDKNIGKILYDPLLSCDHHYTEDGNTWKGVG